MTDTLATLGFKADTGDLDRAAKKLANVEQQGRKTEGASKALTASFASLAASVGVTVSAAAGLNKLIDVARNMDVLNAQLKTATGSADAAADAFAQLEKFARETPYSLDQAVTGFTRLVNLGLTPSEKALRSYGNTASAMGKDLMQMVEAVADATVGEFERLKEFGIKAKVEGDNVTFRFRGITTTVKNSAEAIEGYLMSIGENEFGTAMADRMNSLDGALSNMADSWNGLFRSINSSGVSDAITGQVRSATAAIESLSNTISSGALAASIKASAGLFDKWGYDIAFMLDALNNAFATAAEYWHINVEKSVGLMTGAFSEMPQNIRAFIQLMVVEWSSFADKLIIYRRAVLEAMNPFGDGANPINQQLESIEKARLSAIDKILKERDESTAAYKAEMIAASDLLKVYKESQAARAAAASTLGKHKAAAEQVKTEIEEVRTEFERLKDTASGIDSMFENGLFGDAPEQTKEQIKEVQTLSEHAAERIEQAFADAWLNAFDGMKSVVSGMKNAFKRMLAEMMHLATTNRIMVSLGFSGFSGAASAATGAAAGGGIAGLLGGGITGLGSMIGGTFGAGMASTGALLGTGTMAGLTGAIGSVGSMLSSGSLMAAAGAAMPLIAGAVVAAMGVNKLTGGNLFGTDWKQDSQTLGLSLGGGDISGSIATQESKKKSLFRGTKRRTTTTAFDATAIDDAFDAITDTISSAAKTFGIVGADEIIKGFSASASINIKGKTEAEIQSAIEQWVGSTTEGLVNAVFGDSLDGLRREGEGVIDTVNRLSANMSAMRSISDVLGLNFGVTGKAAMIAATNIIDLVGGLDALNALTTQYYTDFYSEAERAAMLGGQLNEAFAELGLTMPTTKEGFRALVDGIDLTTESGQKLFAELMKLVPGLSEYLNYMESQAVVVEDNSAAIAKANEIAKQRTDLEIRLQEALGNTGAALEMRRQLELASADESLRALLLQIYAAEDAAKAAESLAKSQEEAARVAAEAQEEAARVAQQLADAERALSDQRQDLELRLLDTLGMSTEALAIRRQLELASMDESLHALLKQIYAAEDAAKASELMVKQQQDAADAARALADAERALSSQRQGLELRLLDAMGMSNEALAMRRQLEKQAADASLHGLLDQIYAAEDAAKAAEQAKAAQDAYNSAMADAVSFLTGTFAKIKDFARGLLSTNNALEASYRSTLAAARRGDRDALGNITGAASSYLEQQRSTSGSFVEYQRKVAKVAAELLDLPNRVSAEQFIANEFKGAIRSQTSALTKNYADALKTNFDALKPIVGESITLDEFKSVYAGTATDVQLEKVFKAIDLSGDGIITKLESVGVASMPTDAILANVLQTAIDDSAASQLTYDQAKEALSGIATDAEIDRLIKQVDANGDGIITAQELAITNLGKSLPSGIASSLKPRFDSLGGIMRGRLTAEQLAAELGGKATDAAISQVFDAINLNRDSVVSALESVVVSSMPTDSVLAGALRPRLDAIKDKTLTKSQITAALSGIATDAQIKALIAATDANGDGVITELELNNTYLAGLSVGIAGALSGYFTDLDTSLDGLIDYAEFGKAFNGMATDAQLREIFAELDTNGDGTISKLESVIKGTDATSGNTSGLVGALESVEDEIITLYNEMYNVRIELAGHIESLVDEMYNVRIEVARAVNDGSKSGEEWIKWLDGNQYNRNQWIGDKLDAIKTTVDNVSAATATIATASESIAKNTAQTASSTQKLVMDGVEIIAS